MDQNRAVVSPRPKNEGYDALDNPGPTNPGRSLADLSLPSVGEARTSGDDPVSGAARPGNRTVVGAVDPAGFAAVARFALVVGRD